MKLADIAKALNARVDNASPNTEITGVAGIEQAAQGQLTFVSNPKYNAAAKTTKASAVIVAENSANWETTSCSKMEPWWAATVSASRRQTTPAGTKSSSPATWRSRATPR